MGAGGGPYKPPFPVGFLLLNILQALFLATWSVFCISFATVAMVVTLNRNVALMLARRLYSPALIWATGADFRLEPLPQVDWSKPHIFVMNHQSMLDIVCAFAGIPVNLRFVAKHSLKFVPFLGWYMWMTGMVFIDRTNRSRAVRSLALAGERIRGGANIIVFPEGTRSRNGEVQPFKKGPFVLALEAKVPIIPVAIEGSGRCLPSDGFRIRPAVVRMKLGLPIETAGRESDDARDDLLRDVRDAIIRLNRELGGVGGSSSAIAAAGEEGIAARPQPSHDEKATA